LWPDGTAFRDARPSSSAGRDGFDVVYLPPIHPIGRTARKGPDNALVAGPGDPGSPWAIGGPEGGHTAVHPELGTLDDFRRLVKTTQSLGMEIALDLAIQCSPDHPWVREHPEWFYPRPDGTIKYAENPPKKYQDIYPINFATPAWESLWDALLGVVRFWIEQGVRTFRVDNPHTKPLDFWAWLIREIQDRDPDVVFLSEAFTQPKVMRALAKMGFTQSYTYFTWRNFKEELTEYLTELTQSEMVEYFRGNFFVNTPDILPEVLQRGGPPAFRMRAALGALLSSLWGVYSGFELCENAAVPGTEEYLDSEKYDIRVRDWDAPGHIKDFIARLNRIRRENPRPAMPAPLLPADSPHVLSTASDPARQRDPGGGERTLRPRACDPSQEIGIGPTRPGPRSWAAPAPRAGAPLRNHRSAVAPAHIYRVGRWRRRERDRLLRVRPT
jgi:starch synthase (maltosyl-transferring)